MQAKGGKRNTEVTFALSGVNVISFSASATLGSGSGSYYIYGYDSAGNSTVLKSGSNSASGQLNVSGYEKIYFRGATSDEDGAWSITMTIIE